MWSSFVGRLVSYWLICTTHKETKRGDLLRACACACVAGQSARTIRLHSKNRQNKKRTYPKSKRHHPHAQATAGCDSTERAQKPLFLSFTGFGLGRAHASGNPFSSRRSWLWRLAFLFVSCARGLSLAPLLLARALLSLALLAPVLF